MKTRLLQKIPLKRVMLSNEAIKRTTLPETSGAFAANGWPWTWPGKNVYCLTLFAKSVLQHFVDLIVTKGLAIRCTIRTFPLRCHSDWKHWIEVELGDLINGDLFAHFASALWEKQLKHSYRFSRNIHRTSLHSSLQKKCLTFFLSLFSNLFLFFFRTVSTKSTTPQRLTATTEPVPEASSESAGNYGEYKPQPLYKTDDWGLSAFHGNFGLAAAESGLVEDEVDVDLSQLQVQLPNVRFDCGGRDEGYYGDPDYKCEVRPALITF